VKFCCPGSFVPKDGSPAVGDFGTGWNVSLRNIRVEASGVLGKAWRQQL
jgi:hypothetical protein